MVEVTFSSSFKRAYRKRIRNNPGKVRNFSARLGIFIEDPHHPILKTHKLSGELVDLWSFSIAYDLRVIFYFSGKAKAVFVDIGSHDEVY